ncbi:hypothetical protein ACEF17_13065, partial [Streptococcus hyovaginalis]
MKPILIDLPETIEPDRLVIRPWVPGDGKDVYETIQRSQEDFKPWMSFANQEQKIEEVEAGFRESYAKKILREEIRIQIYLKKKNVIIGSNGLH